MDLRECSEGVVDDLLFKDNAEGFVLTSDPTLSFSFSRFSPAPVEGVELPKSREVPGVLGVFAEDPNDAKAPDPRPKADEAPLVGEAAFVVVKGAMPLNGLDLLLKDPSPPPKRFAGWYGREFSDFVFSLLALFELDVERASLLELSNAPSQYLGAIGAGVSLLRPPLP